MSDSQRVFRHINIVLVCVAAVLSGCALAKDGSVLKTGDFKHYVDYFNETDNETVVNHIGNAKAWPWLEKNIPLFECPDKDIERIYYFRW